MEDRNCTRDTVPAAGFILFRRNPTSGSIEFLLLQSRSGKFGIPKGHVEKFESVFDAAVRETKEETGLKQGNDFKVVPDFNCSVSYEVNNTRDGHKTKIITLWLGEVINRNCEISVLPDHRGYKWVGMKEAVLCFGTRPGFESFIDSLNQCVEKINTILK